MTKANEKWSLNSGKWAYGQKTSSADDGKTPPKKGGGAARVAVYLIGLAMAGVGGVWLGSSGLITAFDQGALSASDTLNEENAELQRRLQDIQTFLDGRQKTIDEQKTQLEEQKKRLEEASRSPVPTDFTVTREFPVQYNGVQWIVIADHKFTGNTQTWTRANCYVTPIVDGVKFMVDLVIRESPGVQPTVGTVSSTTLGEARMQWAEVFFLGSKCNWLDEASFTVDQLAALAGERLPPTTRIPALPPPDNSTEPLAPMEVQRTRQVFTARDLPGGDGRVLRGLTQDDCEASCRKDLECKGFTYDRWNRLCITKKSIGELRVEPRSVSVVYQEGSPRMSTAPMQMLKRRGRAFPNVAYQTTRLSNYDDCAQRCLADERCLGVNFVEATAGCYLFSAPSEYSARAGTILGIKQQ